MTRNTTNGCRILPVNRLAASMALALLLSLGFGQSRDNRYEGTWKAVKITCLNGATREQRTQESRLRFYSIELRPHHRAVARFVRQIKCRWSLRGATVKLLPRATRNRTNGRFTTINPPPILLSVSREGRILTRTFDGRTFTFVRTGK